MNFKNAMIIMTSNVGARQITETQKSLGFGAGDAKEKSAETIKNAVMSELRKTFKPEFLNRVDDTIVFNALTEQDIEAIAKKMLSDFEKRTQEIGIAFQATDEVAKLAASEGFDKIYGARPLRRYIQSYIEDPLSEYVIEGRFKKGDHVTASVEDGKVVFN